MGSFPIDYEYEYQVYHIVGDLAHQRDEKPRVVDFMLEGGYREAWCDVMSFGCFIVFKRLRSEGMK